MLVLIFYIDAKAYCTKADSIECIIPDVSNGSVNEKGLLSLMYKRKHIDILDLNFFYTQRPSASALGTRISIVKNDTDAHRPYWGFRAECMRQLHTLSKEPMQASIYVNKTLCQYVDPETIHEALKQYKVSKDTPLDESLPVSLDLCCI